MASEWATYRLDDIVEIYDGPHATPSKRPSGPIFLGISDLKDGRIDLSNVEHISEEDFVRWTRRVTPRPGDLVFSYETRLGEAALIPAGLRCCLGRRMGLLRTKRCDIDSRYLLYAYLGRAFQETLRKHTVHGSTVERIPLAEMGRFPITMPPIEEQISVASILGAIDDKIELNKKMNGTLEAMARALFKSWFVDFDPVRAKAESRDPGLPSHIAALFPDSFVDSVVGEIPAGWKSGSLADYALLNPESWSKETRPDAIRYADLANTKWGKIEVLALYSRDDAPSRAQRVLRPGDTIVGTVRPGNGSYAMVDEDGITGSTGFAVLRPQAFDYREFVYLAATADDNIEALAHVADGGAYPAIRPEIVLSTPTVCPPAGIVTAFAGVARPLLCRIAHNGKESRSLAAIRDLLLPKLIPGDLRVAS